MCCGDGCPPSELLPNILKVNVVSFKTFTSVFICIACIFSIVAANMSSFSSSRTSSSKRVDPLLLGDGYGSDRLMSYCPSLNIYRVNRFNILTNDRPNRNKYSSNWITESDGQQTSVNSYSVTFSNYKFNLKVIMNHDLELEFFVAKNFLKLCRNVNESVLFNFRFLCT